MLCPKTIIFLWVKYICLKTFLDVILTDIFDP